MKGENISKGRKKKGFTQEALAKKVGLHRSTLSAIENGKMKPSLDTLERIAEALNCSMRSFF
ncbi:helix-turn-helix domain-containing protein [Virgibacillus salexigens]|uniref:helix-turn-helix domain-containing protein n=1 Tax=Virgibacillus salexigens TaxID=61016 RepID=UPI00190D0B5E|nr:helix-turn-helix transcriptional regulator [Virgibacillus salexigens]